MPKTLTMHQLRTKKYNTMPFTGLWADSFGEPEYGSNWLIYGDSGHGKTSFCMQITRYMSSFGRVLYVSAEEGDKKTVQDAAIYHDVIACDVLLAVKYTITELRAKLKSRKIKTIVLDSLDDFGEKMTVLQELLDSPKNFIAIAWADGKRPRKGVAKDLLYKVDIKIYVHWYVANVISRSKGGQAFIIWLEEAKKHYPNLNI